VEILGLFGRGASLSLFTSFRLSKATVWFSVILGLLTSSLSPILIRASEVELSPQATIFHRSWMAMLIFVALEIVTTERQHSRAKDTIEGHSGDWLINWRSTFGLLLLLGSTFTIAVVSWAWSLTITTVANSSLLHSLTPIFTGLFAWIAFGQRFNNNFWIGTLIAVSGVVILGISEYRFSPAHLWGDAGSLFSAIFFSVEPVLIGRLRQRLGTYTIMAWNYGIIALIILPGLWLFPDASVPVSSQGWFTLLAMAIICQTIGMGLLAYCLRFISAGVISLLHLSMPLISASIAWLAFGEPLSCWNVLVFVVIIGGIIISTRERNSFAQS